MILEKEQLQSALNCLSTHVDTPAAQLRSDSRTVQAGDVFCAFPIPNSKGDGRRHIEDAITRGAKVVLFDPENFVWDEALQITHLGVPNLIQHLGSIAKAWIQSQQAQESEHDLFGIAVTGTNGKTSCTQWIAQSLSMLETKTAVVGTLGIGTYVKGRLSDLLETGFTTPDAISLQYQLQQVKQQGATAVAIEASSIGLHQGRMNGMAVDVAVLTNLTRDHLDYHGDMETYAAAKQILFQWPNLKAAVVNLDDAFGLQLAQYLVQHYAHLRVYGYTVTEQTCAGVEVVSATHLKTHHNGTHFHLHYQSVQHQVKSKLLGQFNVSNLLAVLAVLFERDIDVNKAIHVAEQLSSVPGRMQQVEYGSHILAVVDYAHTPDALEKTITTLKQVSHDRHGQLWCVFGCGGDRDPGKRPQMGAVAQQADHVVVTSDNPRSEDPDFIIQGILAGMQGTPHAIADRASAILYAIKHAQANDVVLIAGKGHENYQEIKGKKWPFSDYEHAQIALSSLVTTQAKRGSV
jgi:UDP-N-acetylmuramoyl-L-alanyl-D-glutamate--2,6-diaminopimelate ligase